jgi:hypothetical protein
MNELKQVVVVDNASTDGSAGTLKGLDLPLTIIQNNENRGFAAACNQGVAGSKSDYLLFLNPDTQLMEGSLDAPIQFLERPENQMIGIVGIQLLDEEGRVARTCSHHPKPFHFFHKALGLDRLSPGRFSSGMMLEWDHMDSRPVDGVMGAFYLIRRSLFEELGGFDERFFVYFEESDLGYRAWKAGHTSYFLAEAKAYHYGCGASNQVRAERLFYSLRSRIRYGYKHFAKFPATGVLLSTLFLEPLTRIILALAMRSRKSLTETLRGYGMLWASLKDTLSPDHPSRPSPG